MRETVTQLSIPYQTVQFMVKKFSNDREMRRIEKYLKTNPFTTVIELHSRNKTGVHVSTLRRELKKRNYIQKALSKKIVHTKKQREERLEFAGSI